MFTSGDAFIDDDRIEPDLAPHAGGQILRRDDVSARRFEAGKVRAALEMIGDKVVRILACKRWWRTRFLGLVN